MSSKTGKCLCGAVEITATLKPGIGACHCSMCRSRAGGPFMSVHPEKGVEIKGEDFITRYASSDWAQRGFCKQCGTSLFYFLKPMDAFPDGEYVLSAGLYEDLDGMTFDHEVYVDHQPGWYEMAGNETRKRMTEADILVMYGVEE